MFDIGWSELLVLAIVALIFVGPKELPVLMRTIGALIHKLKATAGNFQQQFQTAMEDSDVKELKTSIDDISETFSPHNLMGELGNEPPYAGELDEDRWNEAVLMSHGEHAAEFAGSEAEFSEFESELDDEVETDTQEDDLSSETKKRVPDK